MPQPNNARCDTLKEKLQLAESEILLNPDFQTHIEVFQDFGHHLMKYHWKLGPHANLCCRDETHVIPKVLRFIFVAEFTFPAILVFMRIQVLTAHVSLLVNVDTHAAQTRCCHAGVWPS